MLAAGCLLLLLPGDAVAQAGADAAPAACSVDIADQKADVLEPACLREFAKFVSRDGDVLTLQLESGASKVYQDDPKACPGGRREELHLPSVRRVSCRGTRLFHRD
jgi:hypothetical protein